MAESGQEEPRIVYARGVILYRPRGSQWAFIIVNDHYCLEIIEASWDAVVTEAWDMGFRGEVEFENPDVIDHHYAIYILAS